MARCGRGVHIGVKIDRKNYDVDVQRMSSCCALRGAENRVRKTRGDPTDIRYDEVSRWKDLGRDFCDSHPDVVYD
jgi:hypothetical protein